MSDQSEVLTGAEASHIANPVEEPKKPPIISTRVLPMRPPELGKIKIGGLGDERTAQGGRKYRLPMKLDHFNVTGRDRDEEGDLVRDEWVHRPVEEGGVGDEPRELRIRLYFDDPWESFQSSFQQWQGRTRTCICDGEEMTQLAEPKQEGGRTVWEKLEVPIVKPCQRETEGGCRCKPSGRLACYLEAAGFFGGYHMLRTTSWETVRNIQTALAGFHAQFGRLAGIPLMLKMYPREVEYTTDGGQQKKGKAWAVALVMVGTFEEVWELAAQAQQHRLAGAQQLRLLASAHVEHMDLIERGEEEDIGAEFHPLPEDVQAGLEQDMADKAAERVTALKERLGASRRDEEEREAQVDQEQENAAEEPEEAPPSGNGEDTEEEPEGWVLMEGVDQAGEWLDDEAIPQGYGLWLTAKGTMAFYLDGLRDPHPDVGVLEGYVRLSRQPVKAETAMAHIAAHQEEREAAEAEAQEELL